MQPKMFTFNSVFGFLGLFRTVGAFLLPVQTPETSRLIGFQKTRVHRVTLSTPVTAWNRTIWSTLGGIDRLIAAFFAAHFKMSVSLVRDTGKTEKEAV